MISCGLAGAERVPRHAACLAVTELDPLVRLRPVVVELVDVVGEVDQLPLFVVEGDVEVLRVHQFADDGVHRPVELLQVLRCACELGDSVERGLHLLRMAALRLGELRRDVGAGCHSNSVRARVTTSSIVRDGEVV